MSQGPLDAASVTALTALPNLGPMLPGDLVPVFRAGQEIPLQAAEYEGETKGLNFLIYGGGSTIPTGVAGNIYWPFPITIVGATLTSNEQGSVVVDLWKVLRTSLPASDANSIVASDPPSIASAYQSQDTTLSGWTTTVHTDEVLVVNVDSASGFTELTLTLNYVRTG